MSNTPSTRVPTLRVFDNETEYLAFMNPVSREPDTIIRFNKGQRVGTTVLLHELPWSARWQLDQEIQNFIP